MTDTNLTSVPENTSLYSPFQQQSNFTMYTEQKSPDEFPSADSMNSSFTESYGVLTPASSVYGSSFGSDSAENLAWEASSMAYYDPMSSLTSSFQTAHGLPSSDEPLVTADWELCPEIQPGLGTQVLPIRQQNASVNSTLGAAAMPPPPLQTINPVHTTIFDNCVPSEPSGTSMNFLSVDEMESEADSEPSILFEDGSLTPARSIYSCPTPPTTPNRHSSFVLAFQYQQQATKSRQDDRRHHKMASRRSNLKKEPRYSTESPEGQQQAPRRRPRREAIQAIQVSFDYQVRRRAEKECQFCQKCFERKEHLKRHESTHTITFEEMMPCPITGCKTKRPFGRFDNLRSHLKLHLKDPEEKENSRTIYAPDEAKRYLAMMELRKKGKGVRNVKANQKVKRKS